MRGRGASRITCFLTCCFHVRRLYEKSFFVPWQHQTEIFTYLLGNWYIRYLARELHRRRWQHCRVVESSSWGPGSDVALVLFLAAIHRYPRKLVRPLLNCWTFFAVFNSLGKLFHFSTTLFFINSLTIDGERCQC